MTHLLARGLSLAGWKRDSEFFTRENANLSTLTCRRSHHYMSRVNFLSTGWRLASIRVPSQSIRCSEIVVSCVDCDAQYSLVFSSTVSDNNVDASARSALFRTDSGDVLVRLQHCQQTIDWETRFCFSVEVIMIIDFAMHHIRRDGVQEMRQTRRCPH